MDNEDPPNHLDSNVCSAYYVQDPNATKSNATAYQWAQEEDNFLSKTKTPGDIVDKFTPACNQRRNVRSLANMTFHSTFWTKVEIPTVC